MAGREKNNVECSKTEVMDTTSEEVSQTEEASQTEESASFKREPVHITDDVVKENEKLEQEARQEAEAAKARKEVKIGASNGKKKRKILFQLLSRSKFYIDYLKLKMKSKPCDSETNGNPDTAATSSCREPKEGQAEQQCIKVKTKQKKRKFNEDVEADDQQIFDTPSSSSEDVPEIAQPSLFEGGTLRDYQLNGLNWLRSLYENGVNGILADEMGLGKTAQIIALMCFLIEKKCGGPFLIIGPLSTMPNWLNEFERFAPKVPVLLYHGTIQRRMEIASSFSKTRVGDGAMVYPIVLTTYEVPLRDQKFFMSHKWSYMVIDEGHRLKNYKCQLARVLRGCSSENRLLLTGTPLQNNLEELWSLMNFLLPEIFDDLALFETFITAEECSNNENIIKKEERDHLVTSLHRILKPFLLRRLKCDVQLDIPPKKEVLVYAPMSTIQWKLYKATVDRNISVLTCQNKNLDKSNGTEKCRKRACTVSKRYKEVDESDEFDDIADKQEKKKTPDTSKVYATCLIMQSPAMQLKKIANHPYLVKMPLIPGTKSILVDEKLISSSGKLLILDTLLPKLKERDHKVLLFCTMTQLLDIVEEYVILRSFNYVRLDGTTRIGDRSERIKNFNASPDIFIFLISTRAGGLGINLTSADTVIIFDSDWNPQADLQAQDRCHRIGQTKPVVVYRLVTKGTIDEKIVECASRKRRLEKLVIHKDRFKTIKDEKMVSLNELKELLESKDYQKIVHTNKEVLSSSQIEELLDRSDMTH